MCPHCELVNIATGYITPTTCGCDDSSCDCYGIWLELN